MAPPSSLWAPKFYYFHDFSLPSTVPPSKYFPLFLIFIFTHFGMALDFEIFSPFRIFYFFLLTQRYIIFSWLFMVNGWFNVLNCLYACLISYSFSLNANYVKFWAWMYGKSSYGISARLTIIRLAIKVGTILGKFYIFEKNTILFLSIGWLKWRRPQLAQPRRWEERLHPCAKRLRHLIYPQLPQHWLF